MKIKLLKQNVDLDTIKVDVQAKTISYKTLVYTEFTDTGTEVPETYKLIPPFTTPLFTIQTDSISEALGQSLTLSVNWLKDTFGVNNIVTE